MKPLGIGHDYAHCNGLWGCSMRDKCVRYLLHLEAVEMKLPMVTYIAPNRRGGVCEYYWEKEERK